MKQLRIMSILVVLAILFIFANVSPAAAEGQSRHTCVVMADGSVKCWGYNYYGQLGNGTYSHSSTPVDVSGLTGVVKVATGRVHTCALTTSGGVKCWGQNLYGQLGAGYRTTDASGGINTPVDVIGLSSGVAQVSTGTGHTCVLTTGGGVKCWGNNYAGQVGIGSSGSAAEYIFIPTDVVGLTSGVAQISASDRFTCALMTSGGVKCWGLNERGQLGNGTLTDSSTPVDAVGLSSGIIQISTTYRQTYALTTDGAVKYWGLIQSIQTTPVDFPGLTSSVAQISAGENITCAIMTSGGAKCWGSQSTGTSAPPPVSGLGVGVSQISTGLSSTCALTIGGSVKCWGNNYYGQLGTGTFTDSGTPVDVVGLASGVSVSRLDDGLPLSNVPAVNANYGSPYQGNEGSSVAMTAAAVDLNPGTPVTYAWSVDSPVCSFNDPSLLNPTLTCQDNGIFKVTLAYDDGDNPSVISSAPVTFNNLPPIAVYNGIKFNIAWNGVTPIWYEGIEVNTIIDASVIFTDPGTADTYTVEWDWDDGTTSTGSVIEVDGTLTAVGSHSYNSTGFSRNIWVFITDDDGGQGYTRSNNEINVYGNVAPTAVFSGAGFEGSPVTFSFSNEYDPSEEDTLAGLHYAVACSSGGNPSGATYANSGSSNSITCTPPDNYNYIRGKIMDKDGGENTYDLYSHTVENVPPTAVFENDGPIAPGGTVAVSFSNEYDPSPVDTSAGFDYYYFCDNTTPPPVGGRANRYRSPGMNSSTCTFTTAGLYTVYAIIVDKDSGRTVYSTVVAVVDNQPPTADAGGSYSGDEGSAITMSSASASDPDVGDTLTYAWTVDPASCSFDDAGALKPDLTCTDNGSYTATLEVSDETETVSSAASVMVNNVAPILGAISVDVALVPVNTAINASADFTDPGTLDTHSATWDWGDGTTSGTVTHGAGSGSVNDSHSYSVPGVYTVSLTVIDNDSAVSNDSVYEFVVVYDPSGGFVTGGGWIDSPADAFKADPDLTGKASFGFVAKYKKGANLPDGNTQFQFKAGDLNFKSTSYEWLVVAGNKAQFQGAGTINGEGSYTFKISADDDNPDTFRIQIWDGGTVYDNGSQQALGGGSIKVHAR